MVILYIILFFTHLACVNFITYVKFYKKPVTFVTWIRLVKTPLREGNGFYVNDGLASYCLRIKDPDFLKKIDTGLVELKKGDFLKVKVKREQFYNVDLQKIRAEHSIEKVLKLTPSLAIYNG